MRVLSPGVTEAARVIADDPKGVAVTAATTTDARVRMLAWAWCRGLASGIGMAW